MLLNFLHQCKSSIRCLLFIQPHVFVQPKHCPTQCLLFKDPLSPRDEDYKIEDSSNMGENTPFNLVSMNRIWKSAAELLHPNPKHLFWQNSHATIVPDHVFLKLHCGNPSCSIYLIKQLNSRHVYPTVNPPIFMETCSLVSVCRIATLAFICW